MCCEDDTVLGMPPAVIEMVARYRRMRDEQGVGWGEDAFPDFFRWARFSRLGPAFAEFSASGDWAGAVRAAVGDDVPAGIVLVTVDVDGALSARSGPSRPVVEGRPHEGPNVFALGGWHWLIVDEWRGQAVYRSVDLSTWTADGHILVEPRGHHADVVTTADEAWI
ncbi:MAG: hypothetical protein ABW004_13095, partial [Aeromicrobium sp.]